MNAGIVDEVEPQSSASSVLRTLALCDLVDSTGLVERMGDLAGAELIRKHDRLARTLANRHGGKEIDKTDGFMMMFDRPIQAVAFALDYQRGLKQLNAAEDVNLSARVGIHVGDIVVWDNSSDDIARGAKPIEVEGLVKPITSRLMNLALPGQILLSNIAYALAHRAQGELGDTLPMARWRTHGRYRFRGVPDPVPVFEVGEEGLAPLKAPPWSSKAHREVPFWRRPATVVIEALVVIALIAVPLVFFLRPDPAIAFAKRDWVVVGSLHNLTGETIFDDALESALRIGLEQSRYVNVLPDLKVRDTITRMQRDPDKTEVDRAVGSEVAVRDGARALILPTIAEIGGRVRITAEVIDPQTQATVYSETADGIGKESILPSLDTINNRLRVRLGEALATVSNESLPLEKAATKNLDALRAFSIAYHAHSVGDTAQAKRLYERAIELDPNFSRARIMLGSLYSEMDRTKEAIEQFEKALASADRLSSKDKMLAEASLSVFASPREALAKWKVLATLEPDFFAAQGAYAYYSWLFANDFVQAISAVQHNAVPQNPNRGTGHYLLGTLYLGMERYAEALSQFTEASNAGARFQGNYYSATFAAQRKFSAIPAVQKEAQESDSSVQQVSSQIFRLTLALDQGNWRQLGQAIEQSEGKRGSLDSKHAQALTDALLGVRLLTATNDERDAIVRKLEPAKDASSIQGSSNDDSSVLYRALMAARYGNLQVSNGLMKGLSKSALDGDNPAFLKMRILVNTEVAIQQGEMDKELHDLLATLDGTELYTSHLTLMRAYERVGKFREAREHANWLAEHRGRAYAELAGGAMFFPYNVAQSSLAKLYSAEYSIRLGEHEMARHALGELRAIWSADAMPATLAERIKRAESDANPKPAKASGP